MIGIIKLLLLLALFTPSVNASLQFTNATNKYQNFTIEYLYDDTQKLTIEDVVKRNDFEVIPSQFTKGYKYGNAWFKLTLTNNSHNNDFILSFTESIWTILDLYEEDEHGWHVERNGLHIPLAKRGIQDSAPAFALHIKTNETKTLYLKGKTIAG